MDYRKLAGVTRLPAAVTKGRGVKIAILDSGIPPILRIRRRMSRIPGGSDDSFGHSTAISSILFGGRGITGICEQADPFYVKVLDDSGAGSVGSVADGIRKAVADGADVINLSVGFVRTENCPRDLENACAKAFEHGIPIVCAAGNDGGPVNWPAALDQTISVGSAGTDGLKTAYSSVGTRLGEIDVIAPGENLPVLDVTNHLTTASGTSFSTAIVTGIAALFISQLKGREMSASCEEIRYRIRSLATDVGAEGWDELTGYGVVGGKYLDRTVRQKIESGFFGKIIEKLHGLFVHV